MSPERSQQNLTRLGLLSLSVTGTLRTYLFMSTNVRRTNLPNS
jgi:hypothetical protein